MPTADELKQKYAQWVAAWNGELTAADACLAPDFIYHHAPNDIQGPKALKQHISGARSAFKDLAFATNVGPIVQGNLVAALNTAEATYIGGLPGAAAQPGARVSMQGIDILRVGPNGTFVEAWHNSNDLSLMLQLQAVTLNPAS